MDENGSSWYTSSRTTISNCIFSEGIDKQCSNDGGFGYLIGTDSGTAPPSQISLLRNVFISNRDRNPYVKDGATGIEVINNFSYNHKGAALGFGSSGTTLNAIKNYYKHGSDSILRPSCYLKPNSGASLSNIHLDGNIDTKFRCDSLLGEETDICHKESNAAVSPDDISSVPVFAGSGFVAVDAGLVPGDIFPEVGAIHPVRDSIDTRILDTANIGATDCNDLGTGVIISSVGSVGGFPTITLISPPLDSE